VRLAVNRPDRTGRGEGAWDVLCQCGDPACEQWVELTLAEYEALQAAGAPILAPGHRRERRPPVRGRARRLAEDAGALWSRAGRRLRRVGRRLGESRRR